MYDTIRISFFCENIGDGTSNNRRTKTRNKGEYMNNNVRDDAFITKADADFSTCLRDGTITKRDEPNCRQGFCAETYGFQYADHSIQGCGVIVIMIIIFTNLGIMNCSNLFSIINYYCAYVANIMRGGKRSYDMFEIDHVCSTMKTLGLSRNVRCYNLYY
jgi:hypothetical protein